jgi:hypothetical protein
MAITQQCKPDTAVFMFWLEPIRLARNIHPGLLTEAMEKEYNAYTEFKSYEILIHISAIKVEINSQVKANQQQSGIKC